MPPVWKARLRWSASVTALVMAGVVAVDLTGGREGTGLQSPAPWLVGTASVFTVAMAVTTALIRPYLVDSRGSYARYQASLVRQAVQDVRQAARVPDGAPLTRDQQRLVREALAQRRRVARLLGRDGRRTP